MNGFWIGLLLGFIVGFLSYPQLENKILDLQTWEVQEKKGKENVSK